MKDLILNFQRLNTTEMFAYLVGAYDIISFDFEAVQGFFVDVYNCFNLLINLVV